jgi:Rieske Fe-S protein
MAAGIRSTGMEPTAPTPTRRSVLAAGVAIAAGAGAAGVAAIAGCAPSKKSGTATGAASDHAPVVLAKVADIPVGDAVSGVLDGQPILIAQPTAGTIVAFTAICTHQGCTVAPAGKTFHCPCHDSFYNAATGAVISGPAPEPLAAIPVTVTGGDVLSR